MFSFIKTHLKKIYQSLNSAVQSIFGTTSVDQETFKELERILIEADTGMPTTRMLIKNISEKLSTQSSGQDLKDALEQELISLLKTVNKPLETSIYLLVGINGSGKTTFAGKLAYQFTQKNYKTLLAAADTFRAAAPEQLNAWANRAQCTIIGADKTIQDPAAIVYEAATRYTAEKYEKLIIDTAGRLQNKVNLMRELEKIKRVLAKQVPGNTICTLLVIDAMLGQNSLDQARMFNETIHLDGIVLSKVDGTGKGGIIFAIAHELKLPIYYLSYGEQIEDIKVFDPEVFIRDLLNS